MVFIGKLVIAFVTTLTYPTVSDDVVETFGMDLVCNMEDDCEIVIVRTESHYAVRQY